MSSYETDAFEDDLEAALVSEKDSAEVMYFCLTYPDISDNSCFITMEWVKGNWVKLRNHIPLDGITIKNKECTEIEFVLPDWLGRHSVNVKFYRPSETDIVIDCLDMHMKYSSYKKLFDTISH